MVRFDPEDYAFIAHYSDERLAGQVTLLGKATVSRLMSVAIALVGIVFIWWKMGALPPGQWFWVTKVAAITVAVALVVAVVALVVEKAQALKTATPVHVVMLVIALVASGALLEPVWVLRAAAVGYRQSLVNFATLLNNLPTTDTMADSISAVNQLANRIGVVSVVLLVLLVVAAVMVLASFGMIALWLVKPRSLGWPQRRLIAASIWVPPIILAAGGLGVLVASKFLAPGTQKTLDLDPTGQILPGTRLFDDWQIWMLLAGLLITSAIIGSSLGKLSMAAILLTRLPQGNALRVDALGLVVDDTTLGPQRVTWPAIGYIKGRARQGLPGPELAVGYGGRPAWTVPFMYLDALPGTIDSAIRANTKNTGQLDLCPLDNII